MHRAPKGDKISRAERRRLDEVARIKSKLIVRKLTLAEIDAAYGLPPRTASNTLHEPHLAGERAIAAALKTRPELLWFTRYSSDGRRLAPQPSENYRHGRRPSPAQDGVAA